MKKEIDLFIYDLDGTLIDSAEDITHAVNHMLTELKLPNRSKEEVRGFIGEGVQSLIKRSLGEEHQTKAERGFQILKTYYREHLLDHTKLYPDVQQALQHFHAKKQVVVTNKPEDFSTRILEGLRIRSFFQKVIGGDSMHTKKPSPESIFHILKEFSIIPDRAVIVGDSLIDIETGRNAKITTCAVTYGLVDAKIMRTSGADFVIDRFRELVELFC